MTELNELRAAVATFVERAGEKVRSEGSCASAKTTFVERNRFDPDAPRCDGAFTVNFPVPTNLNGEFMAAADRSIRMLWERGGRWKKAGVLMLGLVPADAQQQSFLDPVDRKRDGALMRVLDAVNLKHGRLVLRSGTTTLSRQWRPLAERCSPRYTTRWEEVPIVR